MKHIDQNEKSAVGKEAPATLTRVQKRTLRKLIDTAMHMLEEGWFPSISELANAAEVSRATAYRYFPTQSALVSAIVSESLGPVQEWQPQQESVGERISELLEFTYPQLERHEGALRAALQVSLQQWADQRAKKSEDHEDKLVRGNRKRLLELATAPLKDKISTKERDRMMHAFSLFYGSEMFLVFKDIWQLDADEIQPLLQWMAKAIVRQVEEDAGLTA